MGEIDLSCFASLVIVAMLFVPVVGVFVISCLFAAAVELASWLGGTDEDDPRML